MSKSNRINKFILIFWNPFAWILQWDLNFIPTSIRSDDKQTKIIQRDRIRNHVTYAIEASSNWRNVDVDVLISPNGSVHWRGQIITFQEWKWKTNICPLKVNPSIGQIYYLFRHFDFFIPSFAVNLNKKRSRKRKYWYDWPTNAEQKKNRCSSM